MNYSTDYHVSLGLLRKCDFPHFYFFQPLKQILISSKYFPPQGSCLHGGRPFHHSMIWRMENNIRAKLKELRITTAEMQITLILK